MKVAVCEAKRKRIVKRRGLASIEYYIGGKPVYFCAGYVWPDTEEALDECKECKYYVLNANNKRSK